MKALKKSPYVTYALLFIMIIVYIAVMFSGGTSNPNVLLEFGAKFNPLIRVGQWWRLITAIFLHMNFIHILFNGITLYFMGVQTEKIFGHFRFLSIFILSGIIGNLFSFALNDDLSAGASTSIFGLFGAFMMLGESLRNNPTIRELSRTFFIFIIVNLALDLFTPGVDLWGHIGGLIGGFLIAYVVGIPNHSLSLTKKIIALFTLTLIVLVLFYVGMNGFY